MSANYRRIKAYNSNVFTYSRKQMWANEVSRLVTSLGHQEGRRVFWEGLKFFELCPIVLNDAQHIFLGEAKKFLGAAPPLVTGLEVSEQSYVLSEWVKLSVAIKHFTARVRKAKFAFNKTLPITFEVWPQSWRKLLNLLSIRYWQWERNSL